MTKAVRFHDWPTRLHAAIESRRATPFKWGSNDCCMFAADVVLAITGADIAAQFRGKYDDALGAARVLRETGGISGAVEAAAAEHGFACLPSVAYAQRGDLIELDTEPNGDAGGPALGVCVGSMVAGAGEAGTVFVPPVKCRRAWRVG